MGWEDPLEHEIATCSAVIALENYMEMGGATVHIVAKSPDMTGHTHQKKTKPQLSLDLSQRTRKLCADILCKVFLMDL